MGKGPIPLFYFYLRITGLFQSSFVGCSLLNNCYFAFLGFDALVPTDTKFTVEKPAQAVRALALFAVTFPLIFIFEVTAFDWLVGCA